MHPQRLVHHNERVFEACLPVVNFLLDDVDRGLVFLKCELGFKLIHTDFSVDRGEKVVEFSSQLVKLALQVENLTLALLHILDLFESEFLVLLTFAEHILRLRIYLYCIPCNDHHLFKMSVKLLLGLI